MKKDFITVSPDNGGGGATQVTVTADPNTGGTRSSQITISGGGYLKNCQC